MNKSNKCEYLAMVQRCLEYPILLCSHLPYSLMERKSCLPEVFKIPVCFMNNWSEKLIYFFGDNIYYLTRQPHSGHCFRKRGL